jgi:hypothetical protein
MNDLNPSGSHPVPRSARPPVVPAAVSTTLVMWTFEPKFPRFVGD